MATTMPLSDKEQGAEGENASEMCNTCYNINYLLPLNQYILLVVRMHLFVEMCYVFRKKVELVVLVVTLLDTRDILYTFKYN